MAVTRTKTAVEAPALPLPTMTAPSRFPDIKTIKAAIPKHCFEPSTSLSMSYLVRDVLIIGALGWAAVTFIPTIQDDLTRAAVWVLYGFVQGLVCTGLWIIGHEAGHGSFSKHSLLNDCVGMLTHSSLCVPFFSWKFSHGRHHQFTGNMKKDMVFVPRTREDYFRESLLKLDFLEDTPIFQLFSLVLHQLFGWVAYLSMNLSAGKKSLQKESHFLRRSHFDPWSAVFRNSEAPYIIISDIGICMTLGALYMLSRTLGVSTVLLLYLQPYVWVHHWLIAITYLHHTHVEVPHYDDENWTYVKGALATVDRDFGFVGRHLFHGIIEYHVVHHLFTKIPFYYAEEATEAIKPMLGDLYCRDDRSFIGQLWSNYTNLKYVEADAAGAMKWVHKMQ